MKKPIVVIIFFTIFSLARGHFCLAQPIAPRALYNPVNGAMWFDQLDTIFDEGYGTLTILTLSDGNIQKKSVLGDNGVELEITSAGRTTPIAFNESIIKWRLEGPFGESIVEPVFAGYIIEPGTEPTDIYLQAFAGRIGFPTVNATRIPEPTSFLLAVGGGICCGIFRRRML